MSPSSKTATAPKTVTCQPFPNSRKVYVQGSDPSIRVPMREVSQTPTRTGDATLTNPPIMIYDTSGPYTDPDATY